MEDSKNIGKETASGMLTFAWRIVFPVYRRM